MYVHLPYRVQVRTSGVRQWGLTGPKLGLQINRLDLYQTCQGDERLFAKHLPDLKDVPVQLGPDLTFHVTTHSLGFDDIGFRTMETGNSWDGVVVGDSFSFCTGVEIGDCWITLLSQQTGLRLANLGVNGTGSVSHLRYLEDYGWSLNPKVVIWQYYGNDARDDYYHLVNKLQGCPRPTLPSRPNGAIEGTKRFFSDTFVTYNLIVSPLLRRLLPSLSAPPSQASEYEQNFTATGQPLFTQVYSIDPGRPEWSAGLTLTQDALLAAKAQAEQHGARFLIMLVPVNFQVYEDQIASDHLIEAAHSWDTALDEMAAFLDRSGIEYVDLRSDLRHAAAQGVSLYPAYDVHWTPQGNRIVADAIQSKLVDLLPTSDGSTP